MNNKELKFWKLKVALLQMLIDKDRKTSITSGSLEKQSGGVSRTFCNNNGLSCIEDKIKLLLYASSYTDCLPKIEAINLENMLEKRCKKANNQTCQPLKRNIVRAEYHRLRRKELGETPDKKIPTKVLNRGFELYFAQKVGEKQKSSRVRAKKGDITYPSLEEYFTTLLLAVTGWKIDLDGTWNRTDTIWAVKPDFENSYFIDLLKTKSLHLLIPHIQNMLLHNKVDLHIEKAQHIILILLGANQNFWEIALSENQKTRDQLYSFYLSTGQLICNLIGSRIEPLFTSKNESKIKIQLSNGFDENQSFKLISLADSDLESVLNKWKKLIKSK